MLRPLFLAAPLQRVGVAYTRRTRIKSRCSSAAFVVPEQKVEYSVRLTDKTTIFAAELTAIKLSLRWAITAAHKNITIFSDSLSALQAIDSGKTHNRPNLLLEVQELITQHAHSITPAGR